MKENKYKSKLTRDSYLFMFKKTMKQCYMLFYKQHLAKNEIRFEIMTILDMNRSSKKNKHC